MDGYGYIMLINVGLLMFVVLEIEMQKHRNIRNIRSLHCFVSKGQERTKRKSEMFAHCVAASKVWREHAEGVVQCFFLCMT